MGTDKATVEGQGENKSEENPRVLIAAISGHLYNFSSSTPSILYISKVDSSGYSSSATPLPLTRHLIRAFILYFLAECPALRVQLFARAQRQYLFANSADWKGKKVLGGAGLCKWWKGVYEDVASSWASSPGSGPAGLELEEKKQNMKLGFILPGYDEQEAKTLLGTGRPLPKGMHWTYTPPFTSPLIPSPPSPTVSGSGSGSGTRVSLATLIPSLPDDPKTRFLEELVSEHPRPPNTCTSSTTTITSSTTTEKKQGGQEESKSEPEPGSESGSGSGNGLDKRQGGGKEGKNKTRKGREAEEDAAQRTFAENILHAVGIAEFWERMGFRQECASGDVTGFFTLESGSALGMGLERKHASGESSPATTTTATAKNVLALLPQAITERLLTALTNLDFANPTLAVEGSTIWLEQTHSIVAGEVGEAGWEVCVARIEAKAGQAGQGGQVGQAGAVIVTGAERIGEGVRKKEEVVTMLQPRKKKKIVQ
ncbi:hypothetical protein I314_06225 [Cryptococcus bacillisporus CA1873]|uniref:histone acetyltransferase n=1 Tax=Cryptococcus bacillisporus CA1873 TaxID=1296111 RepID=A0ABR5B2Z5_CRYGA|nr:hypothetical protein I314_06225 [Cryptococcus bacillisporus CA1873]|eukprot:KIR57963.1 hypothetical protein I314_06225 [Cryptococcus gattii CA1873]